MISQLSHIMTLANSIIGVSVLAMPFCFKQCGIVLATLLLLLSSILSRLACHFLVKSAIMSRRRNFELLAFHAFGHMGKFLVELFIIGFLVGTCTAFFVVVGDLGPQIIGKMIGKNPEDIRTSLLITTGVFIVLPLGLLRNIDSLANISTATIGFYFCLVLKVITESTQHIFAGDWNERVYYWRPAGILQCLPIFSMALFCQTQLFEIYEVIPNVSLEKMNEVVRGAINICTLVYLCVGFFGYIAFCTVSFTGNILMSFEDSLSSEIIKMGFVFSVAFSFPLVIFPCRASLNSLLFRRVYTHEPSINYIPETRFKCLTLTIVSISLITGILIPNIEFVLGLVGSTIGVMICLIFPAAFFISISSKNTNERLLAQGILFVGVWIMVLGTYANLYAMEESTNTKIMITTNKPHSQINNLPLHILKDDINMVPNVPNPDNFIKTEENTNQLPNINLPEKIEHANDIRQEPPIPVERIVVTEKINVETQKSSENIVVKLAPKIKKIVEKIKTLDENANKEFNLPKAGDDMKVDIVTLKAEEKIKEIEKKQAVESQKNDNLINSDAIKKEESELAADGDAANMMIAERHEELRKTLEKHKMEQLQMIQEQKQLLKDLKEQKKQQLEEQQRKEESKKDKKQEENHSQPHIVQEFVKDASNGKIEEDKSIMNKVAAVNEKFLIINDENPVENEKVSNLMKSKNEDNKNQQIPKESTGNNVPNKNVANKSDVIAQEETNKLSNGSDLLKGSILKALVEKISKPVPEDIVKKEKENFDLGGQQDIVKNIVEDPSKIQKNIKNTDSRLSEQYAVPIALKMRNQTKVENSLNTLNKSDDGIQVIHRDILENHEREKREVSVEMNNKIIKDESIITDENGKCLKPEHNTVINTNIRNKIDENGKTNTTPETLIKTNVYLSEQKLTDEITVDSNIGANMQYVKLNKRDLKALKKVDDNRGL